MDELELLIAIIVGLFKLVRWIVKSTFKALWWILRAMTGRLPAQKEKRSGMPAKRDVPRATAPAPVAPKEDEERIAARQREAVADEARALLRRERDALASEQFIDTLEGIIADAARPEASIEWLSLRLAVAQAMIEQRKDDELLDILGDTDSLAHACYAPIVDHCAQRGIQLSSNRVATVIGGDKLFFLSVDDPSGLATIVLPENWRTELVWWPAVAHEVAHDFYRSVKGLPRELANACALGADKRIPTGNTALTMRDLTQAVCAWQEELFADAFGTMMLGPAYVATMSMLFARVDAPEQALAAEVAANNANYEEHPPGHVRVVAACKLLAAMGYGKIADEMEASWRARHGEPNTVILPTRRGRWVGIPDGVICDRAAEVGLALYERGFASLDEMPLRGIAGLDFGPREHELTRSVAEALVAGRRPLTRDARMVIGGAVFAWLDRPDQGAAIVRTVRALIEGIGAPRRRRSLDWAAAGDEAASSPDSLAAELRDAVILDMLLSPPPSMRGRVRGRAR